jgi:hypothetical protein
MPRENSFSDSDGRSLTPDLEEELNRERAAALAPTSTSPLNSPEQTHDYNRFSRPGLLSPMSRTKTARSSIQQVTWASLPPKERFRVLVRRVMFMNRGTSLLSGLGEHIGAEPGINPRRPSAEMHYGHIHEECIIEIMDYSAVRSSSGRMTNEEFIGFLNDPKASESEPWVKVRWINVGGISWDVIKAISLKYGELSSSVATICN